MAEAIEAHPATELIMQPELGVVLFRRDGWGAAEWKTWATGLLRAGTAFVAPSTYKGEPVGRLVFMHPRTPAVDHRRVDAQLVSVTSPRGAAIVARKLGRASSRIVTCSLTPMMSSATRNAAVSGWPMASSTS